MNAASDSIRYCSARLKALADPTRLAIVEALRQGPRFVHELGEQLALEQSLLSHHLRRLRELGLVNAQRVGKAVSYRLAGRAAVDDGQLDLGCCALHFGAPVAGRNGLRPRSVRPGPLRGDGA